MPREMKDSGIEWIGEIPSEWKVAMLKRIASIQTGSTPAKSEENIYYSTEKGIPWIKAENLGTNLSIKETTVYLTDDGAKEGRVFEPNTVYVCCIASVGKVGYSELTASCNQQINALCFKNFNWKYGYYMSCSQEMEYLLNASGNVMKIINSDKQSSIMCPVPPLSEQQKIADYLDSECAKIDDVITKTKTTIEEYKKLKQSVITEAVTKGIRPNREMKGSGIEWIGEIPKEWDVKVAFQLFSQVKNKNEGLIEKNLLSLSYGKIKRKSIDTIGGLLPENFDGYNIIEKDDIVLRLTDLQNDHTSLRVGLSNERGIVTSAYLTLRNYSNNMPLYLYYYLHSYDIYKGFYGMGAGVRQGLNWDGVKLLKIVLPPVEEQIEITDYLEKQVNIFDTLIAKKEQIAAELESYKKSLIYEYVTGKKEVIQWTAI